MQNQVPAQADMEGLSFPGDCSSLEECKALTGGTGFNTPMQIAPSGCTTVTCLEDGCADAYQFPKHDCKKHACSDTTSVPYQSQQEQPDQSQQEQPDQVQQEQPEQSQQEQPKQGQFSPESKTDAPTPAPTPSVPPSRVPVDAPPVSTKESVAPCPAKTMTQSARPPVIPCEVSTLETPVAAMESPSTIAPNLETSRNSSRTASRVAVDSKKADVHEATSASLPPIYSSRSKASDVKASSTHDGKRIQSLR
ncbi:hypothetical protein PsorP6_007728 [Peronosclerospora sorghi]|uniref:Uncharacterized protein n=1 Tax=Peronosclerospora sorghi TaxID=230839 RepID=A0ACC0W991_9STRA|nr:hypothetical protein PsorP6_007728 [Peronosclerospora sorghi]